MLLLINSMETIVRWFLAFMLTGVIAVVSVVLIAPSFWPQSSESVLAPISISATSSNRELLIPSGELFGAAPQSESVSEVVSETTLSLTLKGVFPAVKSDQGMAIVANKAQVDGLFQTGDEVSRGVLLVGVYSDHIILLRGGKKESLYFEHNNDNSLFASADSKQTPVLSTAQTSNDSGSGVLPGSARSAYQEMSGSSAATFNRSNNPLINDINQLSVAQMIDTYEERFKSDPQSLLASSGLEATGQSYRVTGGSPLVGIGLRVGDEILSVNGQSVGNVSADMGLADVMRKQGVARIEMRRGDRRFYVNYPIR